MAAKKGKAEVKTPGRKTQYDQGAAPNKRDYNSLLKQLSKADSKPSVIGVARVAMQEGWDNESVLNLLKDLGVKHKKDLAGIAALRRALNRAGDLSGNGKKKAKASAKKAPAKKKASAKKASAKKKAPAKKKATTAKEEEADLFD